MPRIINAFTWKQAMDDEMLSLVPAQQAWIQDKKEKGVLLHIFLAADMSAGWAVYSADSAAAVMSLLETLPLRRFMNVNLIELAD
jgi:muconolactone delta-isomerase